MTTFTRVLITTTLLSRVGFAQIPGQSTAFTVGSATASRGQTPYGAITVPAGIDSGLVVQIAVIHGPRPGPLVAFVPRPHRTEYVSIVAFQRFIRTIDAQALAG